MAEKASEEIFAVDRVGSEAVRKNYENSHRPLKADEILAQRSAVPAIDSRKRSYSKTTDGIVGSSSKKQRNNWVSNKQVQRLRDSLDQSNYLSSRRLENDQDIAMDLWRENSVVRGTVTDDYLPQPKSKVAPNTVSHPPKAITASGKPMKSVKTPDGGSSYNPLFADWDDLLNREAQKSVDAERKRLRAEQLEAERIARIAAIIQEDEARNSDSAWEGFESDQEKDGSFYQKRHKRKTQAQRNKVNRRKEVERLALHQSKMANRKRQRQELEQLGRYESENEVATRDQETKAEEGTSSSLDDDDPALRRKGIRNISIPEKKLEVVLPDELQESLRRLKPEGNLLDDRFRNLLVNGKIKGRKLGHQSKKKKMTYTEKWTHKDFQIAT